MLQSMTGRPTLGVVPWAPGLWLDVEDSLDLESRPVGWLAPVGEQTLRIAVIRFPHLSNITDIDALAAEPGVVVRLVTHPEEILDADLVMLPGTRATVSDLRWLTDTGLASAIMDRANAGGCTLGICGGYQMLARAITDDVESGAGTVPGLGLLPSTVIFLAEKTLGRPRGRCLDSDVIGYEIHQGVVRVEGGEPFLDGCSVGPVDGTTWHGIFENDEFRRAYLKRLAEATGRRFTPAPDVSFARQRDERLDVLADMVSEHVNTDALLSLIESGPPVLPTLQNTLREL